MNELIKYIANNDKNTFNGKGLLHYKDRTAHFVLNGKSLRFVDHYTNVSMNMTRVDYKTKIQKVLFKRWHNVGISKRFYTLHLWK